MSQASSNSTPNDINFSSAPPKRAIRPPREKKSALLIVSDLDVYKWVGIDEASSH